jgi:hypothetical protein
MENVSSRILDLLGKSDLDSTFSDFLADCESTGVHAVRYQETVDGLIWYAFRELGASVYLSEHVCFNATFHVSPCNLKDGTKTEPYMSQMPFGLPLNCRRQDVTAVLGEPYKINKDYPEGKSERYRIEPWLVVFWYSAPDYHLSEVRVMIAPDSVHG